jgi:hypothetical protein
MKRTLYIVIIAAGGGVISLAILIAVLGRRRKSAVDAVVKAPTKEGTVDSRSQPRAPALLMGSFPPAETRYFPVKTRNY